MRWMLGCLLLAACSSDHVVVVKGAGPPCGAVTCDSNQQCYQDCCRSIVTPCYARHGDKCDEGDTEQPACNGVANGCVCNKSDPSQCPPAPLCTTPIAPICLVLSSSQEPAGNVCGSSISPCVNVEWECNPNTGTVTCMCPP